MSDKTVHIENALVAPRGDYAGVLEKIQAEGICPFCEENLCRHHTQPVLWKSEHWIVTTNAWPYPGTRIQFLLIPRVHVDRIEQLSQEAWMGFFDDYRRVIHDYQLFGSTLVWRSGDGRLTGGSVTHLHANIFVGHPRSPGCEAITALVGFHPPM